MNLDAILAHPALAGLRERPMWLPYLFFPDPDKPGKLAKRPIHYLHGTPCSVVDPSNWTDCATAVATARKWGAGYGVGRVFFEGSGEWFLDLDSCLQDDGQWSPLAQQLVGQVLHGAAVEISVSGKGLHLFGRGTVPPHASKNAAHRAELYTGGRFCAMTGDGLQGDSRLDLTDRIKWVAQTYFPQHAASGAEIPETGPCDRWSGYADDEELIRHALASRSASSVFGNGASFADLWHADEAVLARQCPPDPSSSEPFDRSSADLRLALGLAFWTGRDAARIERLMRMSALVRDKWDRADYLDRTIRKACEQCTRVYGQRERAVEATPAAPIATTSTQAPRAATVGASHILPDTPLETARIFLDVVHTGGTLKHWQGVFYRWRDGAWREASEGDVRAAMYAFIDTQHLSHFKPTSTRVSNAIDALKSAAHLDSTTAPPCWLEGDAVAPSTELLACKNGLLHLPTRTLHPATPRFFALNALATAYEPASLPPFAWLAFLAQVWPDDPEAIDTLQEVFGYLLTPATTQQKVFLLVGPKRSGKGTIARVLTAVLGASNVAGPTLASMAGNFGLQPLVGKLVAVMSDARLSGRTDQQAVAENLLRISGEDVVTVDRKNVPVLTLRLGVRFVMLSNELPRIADASGAMASRFVILRMTESFIGREDPSLTSRLLAELPGILQWAVEGWSRLRARGYFVPPKSSQDAAAELADLGSPIGAFTRDECVVASTAEVEVDHLYTAWRMWCLKQGLDRPGPKAQFCRDLNAAVPGLKQRKLRGSGDRIRTYAGIGLLAGPGGPGWSGQLSNSPLFPNSG